MGYQKPAAIGGDIIDLSRHLDPAEMRAEVRSRPFIVIAGNEYNLGAGLCLGQQRLHHIIMRLRPMPIAPQPPAIHNIANKIDRVGIMLDEKLQQHPSLTTARAEMSVGKEQGSVEQNIPQRLRGPFVALTQTANGERGVTRSVCFGKTDSGCVRRRFLANAAAEPRQVFWAKRQREVGGCRPNLTKWPR